MRTGPRHPPQRHRPTRSHHVMTSLTLTRPACTAGSDSRPMLCDMVGADAVPRCETARGPVHDLHRCWRRHRERSPSERRAAAMREQRHCPGAACAQHHCATTRLERAPACTRAVGWVPCRLVRYTLSGATGGAGRRSGRRRAILVQLGIHQLASPNSFMRAGTSSARMTVASKMIPAATPIASGLTS